MTEPLTPEQARDAASFAEVFIEGYAGSYSHHAWIGVVNKLLPYVRAYADQAERLSAYEEAVGEVVEAWDWWLVDTYDRCRSVPNDAIECLRALQEKGNE